LVLVTLYETSESMVKFYGNIENIG